MTLVEQQLNYSGQPKINSSHFHAERPWPYRQVQEEATSRHPQKLWLAKGFDVLALEVGEEGRERD